MPATVSIFERVATIYVSVRQQSNNCTVSVVLALGHGIHFKAEKEFFQILKQSFCYFC